MQKVELLEEIVPVLSSYEKGNLFEKFIIEHFNERSFKLWRYRESKLYNYASLSCDHGDPDLDYIFMGKKKYRFAVECKWRKNFIDDKIEWAKDRQIARYERFQRFHQIPVFVAIGIGGEPSAPEKLFLTPLNDLISNTDVFESDLVPYIRKPTRRFFYDTVQLKLF